MSHALNEGHASKIDVLQSFLKFQADFPQASSIWARIRWKQAM